ncbi:hypothetical protein FDA94_14105 [Herbidospora galbida]|uniref:Secreted protein n=1 Tax=Herbidospora galbida TaxID=2575442 RepID=A0A4U3MHV7_9ACTN|nr:DUF5719 family protein [Herbidospora galbida]TKK88420.1 hypothetical protein FDA94_14105 [Herbidospora galbida]
MRRLIENRFGMLALVLIALGAVYGVAFVSRPAPVAPVKAEPVRAPIAAVSTVCPDPGGATVTAVTPPNAEGGGQTLIEDGDEPATVDEPGKLWQKTMASGTDPMRVHATGAMAAGLEAAQTRRALTGAARGLAGVRCVDPGADAWFVGPGPAAGDLKLHLANVESAPADVALVVYSGEGQVIADRASGMLLKPGEHRVVDLKKVAPSPLVMALNVSTGRGRVAAAVEAATPEGVDWLPQTTQPAERVVVPGVPGSAGRRELYVAAPGESDAVVHVKAVLKDGSYALENRETVEVPAGSVVTLDLSTGVTGQPAAIVLTSETPVVAGLKIVGTGGRTDVAFTAGAPSIDLGSVVADARSTKDVTSRLILSAPDKAADVTVTLLPREGKAPEPIEVAIPAARTKEIILKGPAKGFSVVVTPKTGSGPVYGGRVMEERAAGGQLVTAQPLAVARTWTLVPPVAEEPSAVLSQPS